MKNRLKGKLIKMREMKDSGISWVGEIPTNWTIGRIGGLYSLRNQKVSDKDYEPLSVTMKGVLPQLETAAKTNDGDNRKLVRKGDFAINSRSDRRGSCGIADRDGSVSLINTILKPRNQMNARYYNWLFHTPMFADEFYKWGHGIVDDLWSTNWEEMKKIQIPVPSCAEQQRIAEFLDRECGKIDGLKADIQAQIDTLEQYKRSVITETVTHGLNPSAPMKDSGAGWMPLIPLHWKADKLKFHLRQRGIKNQIDKQVLSLYREYGIVPKDSRDDNHNVTSEDVSDYRYVRVGDFVVNKMKAWQGSVAVSNYEGIVSPAYFVYEFSDDLINKRYFHYLMRNKTYATEFRRLSGGVREGQWDLPSEALNNTIILLPPLDEQQEIADYLDNKCAEIEQIIADKKTQIETLDGYKKSLIYEYVTGKKEVV